MVFGDFDADGLTGLAILTSRCAASAWTSSHTCPAGWTRATVCRWPQSMRRPRPDPLIITVDCGTTQRAPRSRGQRVAASTSSSRTTIASRRSCPPRWPSSIRIAPTRPTPTGGWPEAASHSRSRSCCSPTSPAGRLRRWTSTDLATIGTVADVAPIVGENRAIARLGPRAPADGSAARDRGAAGACPDRACRRRPGDRVLRPRAAAQRSRTGGGGARGRPRSCWPTIPPRPAVHADALEAANLTRRDLMKAAVADARTAIGGRRPGRRRRSSCAARGRSGSSVSSRPGSPRIAAGPPWSARISEVSSGRRAGAMGRSTSVPRWSSAGTCSSVTGGMPARPGSRCPRAVGRVPGALHGPRRRPRAALTRDSPSRSTSRCQRCDVDYGLHRELGALAPCGPGNPDPLVAVLGLTVTRVRAATGGHSQLTLKRERDVLDGIAFGRVGHRRDRPRGRPARRRRPTDEPARSAGSSRSSSISVMSRPRARTPSRDPRTRRPCPPRRPSPGSAS